MNKSRIIGLGLAGLWILLSYQNCGTENSPVVPVTNPNSSASEFLQKMMADSEGLISNAACVPTFTSCEDLIESSEEQIACLQENTSRFYQSLSCQGYAVVESGNCFFAISSTDVGALEPLHLEGTCFYDNQNPSKALHLDVCTAEYVGFDPSHPSTDTLITAWLDIGNQMPYSRFTKTVSYYPEQGSAEIRLANINNSGELFVDACSKSRNLNWVESIFSITVQ